MSKAPETPMHAGDKTDLFDAKVLLATPNKPGEVILSTNGRDAYVVVSKDGKVVRKLPPEIAARHHARGHELLAKAKADALQLEVARRKEEARVARLPWNRARRWLIKTWASFRAGCVALLRDKPAEAPSPIVVQPPPIPARTLRQRERRKAKAHAESA